MKRTTLEKDNSENEKSEKMIILKRKKRRILKREVGKKLAAGISASPPGPNSQDLPCRVSSRLVSHDQGRSPEMVVIQLTAEPQVKRSRSEHQDRSPEMGLRWHFSDSCALTTFGKR